MEEKLKSANIHTSESESVLYRRHQELTIQVEEKDAAIQRLETQLGKQVADREQKCPFMFIKCASGSSADCFLWSSGLSQSPGG